MKGLQRELKSPIKYVTNRTISAGFGNFVIDISIKPTYTTDGTQQMRYAITTAKNNFKTFFLDLLKTLSPETLVLAPVIVVFLNHTTLTIPMYMKNMIPNGRRKDATAMNIRNP